MKKKTKEITSLEELASRLNCTSGEAKKLIKRHKPFVRVVLKDQEK